MATTSVPQQRPALGIYQIKPRAKAVTVYKTKTNPKDEYKAVYKKGGSLIQEVYVPKVKDPLEVKPREYKLKEYSAGDPEIDPLTGLPYNYVEPTQATARSKSKSVRFPKEIGSPVKSISRTLKLVESADHIASTIGVRFVELSEHDKPAPARRSPRVNSIDLSEAGNEDTKRKRQRRTKERPKRATSKLERQLDNLRDLAEE